ncbi:50S ribosomal protein L35 [Candidatus Peregrinibacteria bacterium CG_4_10_14_0_2_um_filter_43_11]|nr:MAG: 50S ribosomal protein L35 [Candidatus Peregrinibacteria bacterium CG_4_10_14_0_2_um_filter_43_11]
MPGKARPGKIKSSSSAKKRFKKTGKNQFAQQKASHNHLLQQKSKRQKRLAGKTIITNKAYLKVLKRLLPN